MKEEKQKQMLMMGVFVLLILFVAIPVASFLDLFIYLLIFCWLILTILIVGGFFDERNL